MSYQVIARKWRPQTFDQLVGQPHISQVFKNALKNDRLPHALLFTGPRGTGKTSSARILAKSLRCPNSQDFSPCNSCKDCEDISLGRSVDVIEIDGASNNGVDSIRDLRESVSYMPSSGKYKIYIIDEVHMLSTSAFNALLKTLEEPPPHVLFIMATTEAHKIPATILSRCQRFDFRRISTRQIAEHLSNICKQDGIQAQDEALWIIARQGDGSMRDSQSLLDQVITFSQGALTSQSVIDVLGLTDRSLLLDALSCLIQRNTKGVMTVLERLSQAGFEPYLFATDLLEQIRHSLIAKVSGEKSSELLELPDSELRFIENLIQSVSEEDLHMLFDMCLKGVQDISRSSEPRIVLEMVLLRMANSPSLIALKDFLNQNVQTKEVPRTNATVTRQPPPPSKDRAMQLNPAERWYEFVQKLKATDALLAAKVEPLLFLGETNQLIELAIPLQFSFLKEQLAESTVRKNLQALIDRFWGQGYSFHIQLNPDAKSGTSAKFLAEKKEEEQREDLMQKVKEHPKVQSITRAFGGQVKSVDPIRSNKENS